MSVSACGIVGADSPALQGQTLTLDALTELVERTGAKLIAVGDGKQLPSIGPLRQTPESTKPAQLSGFRRVAGAGFEPATFGL